MKKNEMLIKMKEQEKKIKELKDELKESKLKMEEELILKIDIEKNKIEDRKNDMIIILKRETSWLVILMNETFVQTCKLHTKRQR